MATKTPTQLTLVSAGNLDDTAVVIVDDNAANTRKATVAQLRTALGVVTALTGDVTASGPGSGVATIAARAVTVAKFQAVATDRLLGRSTAGSGDVEQLSIGAGLVLSAGVLTASAPAASAPSTTLFTHSTFGGL